MLPENTLPFMNAENQIDVSCFMFCDYARIDDDKLHILGGGWSQFQPERLPQEIGVMVAIKLSAPLALAKNGLPLRILLGGIPASASEAPEATSWSSVDIELPPPTVVEPETKLANFIATVSMNLSVTRPERNMAILAHGDRVLSRFFFRIEPQLYSHENDSAEDADIDHTPHA